MMPADGGTTMVADAELLGHVRGMQWPGAAIGNEHVVARIVAALGGDELDGTHHIRIGERHGAVGRSLECQTEALGDGLQGARCCRGIDLHAPAEERLRANRPAHDVCIGEGRLGPATAVAGRPRIGAGRARADAQHAAFIDPDDRSAAGADRIDIEQGNADRQAVELELLRQLRHAAA